MLKTIATTFFPLLGTYTSIYLVYIFSGYLFYSICIPHSFGEIITSIATQLSPVCSSLNYIQGNILGLFQNSLGVAVGYGVNILLKLVGKG